jgi:hypothetical protein
MKGTKDIEAAGKGRDELTVLAAAALGETIFDRTLEGCGSRDEMADVTHGALSGEWLFIFQCAKTAIAV